MSLQPLSGVWARMENGQENTCFGLFHLKVIPQGINDLWDLINLLGWAWLSLLIVLRRGSWCMTQDTSQHGCVSSYPKRMKVASLIVQSVWCIPFSAKVIMVSLHARHIVIMSGRAQPGLSAGFGDGLFFSRVCHGVGCCIGRCSGG